MVDRRSQLSIGETGRNGTYAANHATRNADVVLALGTRFDDRSTSSWLPGYTYEIPPTQLIHVDLDAAEIGRNYPPALAIVANAKDVLGQLHAAAAPRATTRPRTLAPPGASGSPAWTREWEAHVAPQRGSDAARRAPLQGGRACRSADTRLAVLRS